MALSVSDIAKLLESIPVWKSLVTLPKRLAALEARVAKLEGGAAARTGPAPDACPKCGAAMVVIDEQDHPEFGFAGVKTHAMRCDGCGHRASRLYDPGKGYGA